MLSLDLKTRKYLYKIPDCHNKLNQYGRLALLDREKSYRQHYHSRLRKEDKTSRFADTPQLSELSSILLSKNSSHQRKKLNPQLQEQILKLAELKLDSPKALKHVTYQGQMKIPTVHNDYHSRATNHGFSRSDTGGIFPK